VVRGPLLGTTCCRCGQLRKGGGEGSAGTRQHSSAWLQRRWKRGRGEAWQLTLSRPGSSRGRKGQASAGLSTSLAMFSMMRADLRLMAVIGSRRPRCSRGTMIDSVGASTCGGGVGVGVRHRERGGGGGGRQAGGRHAAGREQGGQGAACARTACTKVVEARPWMQSATLEGLRMQPTRVGTKGSMSRLPTLPHASSMACSAASLVAMRASAMASVTWGMSSGRLMATWGGIRGAGAGWVGAPL
jgi:hypothetical protein